MTNVSKMLTAIPPGPSSGMADKPRIVAEEASGSACFQAVATRCTRLFARAATRRRWGTRPGHPSPGQPSPGHSGSPPRFADPASRAAPTVRDGRRGNSLLSMASLPLARYRSPRRQPGKMTSRRNARKLPACEMVPQRGVGCVMACHAVYAAARRRRGAAQVELRVGGAIGSQRRSRDHSG